MPRATIGLGLLGSTDVRNPVNTIEDMKKLLLGYRDDMRVEIESGIAVTAKTVADLRALAAHPQQATTMFFPHFVDACSREPD
jgi:hypothetical protein